MIPPPERGAYCGPGEAGVSISHRRRIINATSDHSAGPEEQTRASSQSKNKPPSHPQHEPLCHYHPSSPQLALSRHGAETASNHGVAKLLISLRSSVISAAPPCHPPHPKHIAKRQACLLSVHSCEEECGWIIKAWHRGSPHPVCIPPLAQGQRN